MMSSPFASIAILLGLLLSPACMAAEPPLPYRAFVGRSTQQLSVASYLKRFDRQMNAAAERYLARQENARAGKTADIRMLVEIGRDGRLLAVAPAEGQQQPELAEMIQTIVRQAEPFPPLPPDLMSARDPRRPADSLVIVRTWTFTAGDAVR
ncbi:hypothetical protein [Chitinilyticum aquatile]|uniref:hypothetical protein n=1 Tax=Chitinilyticum aquatile TaxID=362520 RepID=UPI000490B689|nr:hypothetical protein [Chitinilyticum aquatile]